MFENCSVNFAGHIAIKTSSRRNAPISKSYNYVLVCFLSKAVHIELVCNPSTNIFLVALRRFWTWRGLSKIISSDNRANFIGIDGKLKES